MSSSYSQCSLFLCPEQYDYSSQDFPDFISALQQTGFISRKINPLAKEQHFFTGDKYLDYIAYMGCAPSIKFDAGKDEQTFCFIKIHNYESAELIHSKSQLRAPQCPNCKKPVNNWQHAQADTLIRCEQCNTTSRIDQFNWRKMAGYARLFIEIKDIFPKEAIPQQALLDELAKITGTNWLYFYSCQ